MAARKIFDKVTKVMVAVESRTGCVFAHVVPQKGVDWNNYCVDVLVEDIKWLGFQRVILKTDNEIAILHLLTATLRELRYGVPDFDQPPIAQRGGALTPRD